MVFLRQKYHPWYLISGYSGTIKRISEPANICVPISGAPDQKEKKPGYSYVVTKLGKK